MKHEDFKIGETFLCGEKVWKCTDKGTRTILAIHLDPDRDSSWLVGPPYAIKEHVFDENDIEACFNKA